MPSTPYPGVGGPLSAKLAKARVNGVVLFQTDWDINPESAMLDTSNPEEGGFENQIPGLSKCEVNISGWYNGLANMYDSPLNLKDGFFIQNVFLYVNDLTGPFWNMPWVLVKGAPMKQNVKDLIKYTFSGKASGAFFYATGNSQQLFGP